MVSRRRSPNYPAIDLGKAIDRIKQLYGSVEQGEFSQLDAAQAWGYKGVNGLSRGSLAALRQYGLVEQPKGNLGKLTPRGLTIALRDVASPDFQSAIRNAAVEPPLFEELFTNGKANAARDALRQFLVVNKGFTDDGATRLIEVLSATKALAHIGDDTVTPGYMDGVTSNDVPIEATRLSLDETSGEANEFEIDELRTPSAVLPPHGLDRMRIPLRLVGGYEATIELPTTMPLTAWTHMIQYLEVMKEAYVQEPTSPQSLRLRNGDPESLQLELSSGEIESSAHHDDADADA